MNLHIHTRTIAAILLISSCIVHARFYPNELLEKLFEPNGQTVDEKDKELANHFSQLPKETQEEIRSNYKNKKMNTTDTCRCAYLIGIASGSGCTITALAVANHLAFARFSKITTALIALTAGITAGAITDVAAISVINKYKGNEIPRSGVYIVYTAPK